MVDNEFECDTVTVTEQQWSLSLSPDTNRAVFKVRFVILTSKTEYVLDIFYSVVLSFCLCLSFCISYSPLTDVVSILPLIHFVSSPLCLSVSYAPSPPPPSLRLHRLSSLTLPLSLVTETFKFSSASSCLAACHVFDVIL